MKDNQTLEYHEEQQFNSENLQGYDNEGQRYFLAYLLRKGKRVLLIDLDPQRRFNNIIGLQKSRQNGNNNKKHHGKKWRKR